MSPERRPRRANGQGSIKRAVDRHGYVTFVGRVQRDGIVYRARGVGVARGRSETTARRLAEANLRELIRRLDVGQAPDAARDRITLAGWVAAWAVERQRTLRAGPTTWQTYETRLRLHVLPYLGHVRLVQLRPAHLVAWRETLLSEPGPNGQPRTPYLAQSCESLLKTILRDAIRNEIPVSETILLMRGLAVPERTERPWLDAAQIGRLVRVAAPMWAALYLTGYATGMRWGELAGLEWRHVLWTAGQVVIEQQRDRQGNVRAPKSKRSRSSTALAVPGVVLAALRALATEVDHAPEDRVFPVGSYITALRQLRRDLLAAGLEPVGFHALRHAHAQAAVRAGVAPQVIAQRMRHASVTMTDRYTHRDIAGGRAAAEALGRELEEAADHDARSAASGTH